MKRIHGIAGLVVTIFIGIHLFNHFFSVFGAESHIELMDKLRLVYRNSIVEMILLATVIIQIVTGTKMFLSKRKLVHGFFDNLQIWTGLYLALFLFAHLVAVLAGRYLFELDTNFYFGVAGLNTFPFNLFFIPYYGFAVISFFGHIATIHSKKMKHNVFNYSPHNQAKILIIFSIFLTIVLFYGLTNHFDGVKIPPEYNVLIFR